MIRTIHGEIWSNDFARLDSLIRDFQSCVRFSYCRFLEQQADLNEIRRITKQKYKTLNGRYTQDAILLGQSIFKKHKDKKIIFGGRKYWNYLKNGLITKTEWDERRNNNMYSRGSRLENGNLNFRISEDNIRINFGYRLWENYKLFIPSKYKRKLSDMLNSNIAYNVQIIRKDKQKFRIIISYRAKEINTIITKDNCDGCIGVDTNPDRIAIANISKDGNFINSNTIVNNKLLYASSNKRNYEVAILVKEIVTLAKNNNKIIAFENLKLDQPQKGKKKLNKILGNFCYYKFLKLLEVKCIENGVYYRKVKCAYTSIIGKLKYQQRFKLTIHESAAYVIGRRGLGFNEKLSLYKKSAIETKAFVIGTLAGKYDGKQISSWRLWTTLNDSLKPRSQRTRLARTTSKSCASISGLSAKSRQVKTSEDNCSSEAKSRDFKAKERLPF